MIVAFFVSLLPVTLRRTCEFIAELLVGAMALFMLGYGEKLVEATWYNTIADFPFLSVGVTYLPIPIGGACLLLFVIERLLLGLPPDPERFHALPH
jgi:TRAP-type C4-dicarboxylate transport system permease small subunit